MNFKYPVRTVQEKIKKAYWHAYSKLSLYIIEVCVLKKKQKHGQHTDNLQQM